VSTEVGRIAAVSTTPICTELTTDQLAGATSMPVQNTSTFTIGDAVTIGGEQHTISDIPDAATLALGEPLTGAQPAETQVVRLDPGTGTPATITLALIQQDGEDEDADYIEAVVPQNLRDRVPDGIRDVNQGEIVTIERLAGSWQITEVRGTALFIDASSLDPTTLPDRKPTAPPASSPAIRAFGDARGITLVAEGIDQTSVLDWYIDGVLSSEPQGVGSRATVVRLTKDSVGAGFVDGNTYLFHVVARNIVGAAAASPDVSGQLNQGVSAEFVMARVVSGFVLAGAITVGNITITPGTGSPGDPDYDPGGINIPLADGGLIQFPADGSPAVITALLTAYRLTVMNYLTILGVNNVLAGLLTLQSSTVAPNQAPQVARSSVNPAQRIGAGLNNLIVIGFGEYDSANWWAIAGYDPAGVAPVSVALYQVNKTTGAVTTLVSFASIDGAMSATKIGTSYYVLAGDFWNGAVTMYRFSAAGAITGSWQLTNNWSGNPWCIGTDGTNILVGRGEAGKVDVRTTASPGSVSSTITIPWSGTYTAVTRGSFDYGADRLLITANNFTRSHTVSGTTATEVTTEAFIKTHWPQTNGGIAYDSTGGYWWSAQYDGTYNYACRFSRQRTTATGRSFTVTYAQGATPTYQSKPSPAATIDQTARSWIQVIGPTLPASPGVKDPDRIGIYLANQLQAFTAAASNFFWFGTSVTGAAAPTVEGFPPGTLGRLASQSTDANGALTQLYGNGDYRLGGKNLDDTVWVNLAHQGTAGTVSWRRHNGLFELRVIATMNVANATKVTLVTTANGFPVATYPLPGTATYMPIYGGFDSFFAGNVILNADGSIDLYQTSGATRAAVRAYINWPIT